MRRELLELRPLLLESTDRLAYFDEELDANEFEIALHTLCGSLIEQTGLGVDATVIREIEVLHQRMELTDNCVAGLKMNRAQNGMHEA